MKITPVFILIFLTFALNQVKAQDFDEQALYKTFKKIVREDQSHLRNNEIRDSLIQNNFLTIKDLLASGVNLNTNQDLDKKTIKKLKIGLVITFIHILQINPTDLLNEETTNLFALYIKEKRIGVKELESALNVYKTDIDNDRCPQWSEYYWQRIESVKTQWQIE